MDSLWSALRAGAVPTLGAQKKTLTIISFPGACAAGGYSATADYRAGCLPINASASCNVSAQCSVAPA